MAISRRRFIVGSAFAATATLTPNVFGARLRQGSVRIDRQAVVRRHNPRITKFDPYSALSVGNGEFAFTADITGLQTLARQCEKDFPLCTASHWGWHSLPAPPGVERSQFRYKEFETHGRPVPYPTEARGQETLFNWLRQNPHRLHLGRIALAWSGAENATLEAGDLRDCVQTLDLWTGLLESRFELRGTPVKVQTCCHPELDLLAVRIDSALVASGKLQVLLEFPYGSPEVKMADWSHPERHSTTFRFRDEHTADVVRRLDQASYRVQVAWRTPGRLQQPGEHELRLRSTKGKTLEFVCVFTPDGHSGAVPGFDKTARASAAHWRRFWQDGGAIDLEGSTDPGAEELERRIVLSQYQTAIHCAGSLPSAETGLLANSWNGKFHLEMHWWHSVHFTRWNRFSLFERSLPIYQRILAIARETARRQGYRGARWPKMIGPDGYDSPSPVGPLLIWQQPHPIYYAELCYRQRPNRQTLEHWREIVFSTAEFMASYAFLDPATERYILGPPLKTVSENTETLTACNPTFELAYWRFGLRTAQLWRERLGLNREPAWDRVLQRLAPLPLADGLYLLQEGLTDTYTKWNWEHPALLGVLGMQPGDGVDLATMRRTVRRVMETWQWTRTWGWDFPMAAMAAARVGEPELAVRALLIDVPKNRYWPNGHNYQRPGLTAYLPGNGGLLAAAALMAAGWSNGPQTHAPGFPQNGKWRVRFENLQPAL